MADINTVTLSGRITRDPELRHTPNGTAVASTGLAVERYVKDGENEVSFFDLTIWSAFAELITKKLRKGDAVAIEGRLRQSRWENAEGEKRSKVEVNVDSMVGEFLYRKADGSDTPERSGEGGEGSASEPTLAEGANAPGSPDDDIPF